MIRAPSNKANLPAVLRRRIWFIAGSVAVFAALSGALYCGMRFWVLTEQSTILSRAERHLEQGDPDKARSELKWLTWAAPDHPAALVLAGRSYALEQNFVAAVDCFARIPADAPQRLEADMRRVKAYLADARFEEAEDLLVQRRHYRAAFEELRWLYFNQFRRREVERLLAERLIQYPDDPRILMDFLNTEFRQQIAEEGYATLKKINERQPDQASIILALGYCHWRLGNLEKAWEHLQRALELRPEHSETRITVGEFLLEGGQHDAVESLIGTPDELQGTTAILADDDRWWWLHSRLARADGDLQRAARFAEEALRRRPHELPYVHGYAGLLVESGRTAEAVKHMHKAREIEACKSRLDELVQSGELESPTRQLCLEVADLCERRGHLAQANGWRNLAIRSP